MKYKEATSVHREVLEVTQQDGTLLNAKIDLIIHTAKGKKLDLIKGTGV